MRLTAWLGMPCLMRNHVRQRMYLLTDESDNSAIIIRSLGRLSLGREENLHVTGYN